MIFYCNTVYDYVIFIWFLTKRNHSMYLPILIYLSPVHFDYVLLESWIRTPNLNSMENMYLVQYLYYNINIIGYSLYVFFKQNKSIIFELFYVFCVE